MTRSGRVVGALLSAFAAAAQVGLIGCGDLAPGELGRARFLGAVVGEDPVPVVGPISDRDGNVYVLEGSLDDPTMTAVSVARGGGGWFGKCRATKGDVYGAHGWVGFSQRAAWYWSGDALVEVSGERGGCKKVLDRDPTTGSSIRFLAVIPHVFDAPSSTTAVALLTSPTEPAPVLTSVDLRAKVYRDLAPLGPAGSSLRVVGTGFSPSGTGVIVVALDGAAGPEGRAYFVDRGAAVAHVATLPAVAGLDEYAVRGSIRFDADELGAGLIGDGRVLVVDASGGRLIDPAERGMRASGVHVRDGELWVVGHDNDRPLIAPIDGAGRLGEPRVWQSSLALASTLAGGVAVIDDRRSPPEEQLWPEARALPGPFPLLTAHQSPPFSGDSVLFLFGGPTFRANSEPSTLVAVAPAGVSYP